MLLPDMSELRANERSVSFVRFECLTCGQLSFWVRSDDDTTPAWDGEHKIRTGHRKYYLWSINRQIAEVW